MQSKRKSSWKILVVAAAANLLAGAALAAPDAPHDAGNAIGCLTCHQMTSTYPKLLPPLGGTPVDMDDTPANRVCRSCHDGSGSTLILTDTHSSLTMSNKYGDWTVECWVCHNEHLQEQNRYNGSTYGMYIRRNINLANIKKPDGTSLKTGTKAVVFTGPATFADGNAIYNGICEVCHTQTTHFRNDGSGSDQNHGGKEGSDCVSCHNHDTGFTGGAVHNTFIADDNKTGDVNTKCSGCHSNYATAPETAHSACAACHTTAPTLLDSTFPTANGQVDDDGSSMFANLAAAGYTFNGTTGRLNDPDGTDIAGVGGNGVFAPVKCGVCHAAKPDALAAVPAEHGGHPVTDWDYSAATSDCVDCHDDGGKGTIEGVHSNTCTICHVDPAGGDFARKIGDAANGVDGDATLNPAGVRTGDCQVCHPSATYTKTKIHHDTANATATPTSNCTTACHNTTTGHAGNHNTLVAIQNPNCQGCHNTAAASGGNNVPVDGTSGNLVHDYCTSCHVNPSNDLIGTVATPTAHATTMNNADGTTATNNGGGTCTACHTAYFDGHGHSHTMSTVSLCANCHNAVTAPYTAGTEVHNATDANGCFTCHNSSTGALQGSAGGKTGGDCQNCHTAYFNGHSHGHTMPTVALCTSCHTATAAPYTGAGQVHATSTCATCHDLDATPTGALIGSATGKVGGEDCQGCHAAYFDGHEHGGTTASPNHTETITKDALCGNCHGNGLSGPDAITAPYTAGTEAHSSFGCMTCHSPINGAPLVGSSAANWGATWNARANGTCATCHTDAFSGHSHAHTFTATPDCATCHGNNVAGSNARDAITAPFVGAGEVHAASGCATCHNAGTGALIGSATGHAAATGCIDCHTATWTDIHDTAAGVTHATRVEPAAACTNCHGNPTPVTSNARDAQATPYIVAGDVHAAGCALCHTGNNNGGLRSSGLTKADTVTKGTCTTCHAVTSTWTTIHDTATGAVAGVSHATRVDGLATCTTCHTATAGGAAGVMPYNSGDDKVHDACATCHQATGALIAGNTTYGNQPIAKGDCGTCHTAGYFPNHTHHYGANNELSYNAAVDLAQDAPGTPCASCHTNNADGSGTPLNSFTDILGEHETGCGRCHSYTNADNMNTPPLATNNAAISTAGAKTCISCHTPKIQPATHGGHDVSQFAWTASCGTAACHDSASNPDVANDIHGDGTTAVCTLCHSTASGGTGTTKVGDSGDGDATNGNSLPPHSGVQCTTCHNDVALGIYTGGIHHDTVPAATNSCDTCHDGTALVQNHSVTVASSASCVASQCHTSATAGTATSIQVSAVDGLVHNACISCHTFDANLSGVLRAAPGTKGVTVLSNGGDDSRVDATPNGGGDCIACHYGTGGTAALRATSRVTFHHANVNTAAGNCDYCHYDHRPDSGFSTANANAANGLQTGDPLNSRVPTHLMCEECHVNPESRTALVTGNTGDTTNTRMNGYAGGNVTVQAYNKGTDTYKAQTTFRTFPTKSAVHTVPNTAGKIDNWGICITCHDGSATLITGTVAATVNPGHAIPVNINNGSAAYDATFCWDTNTARGVSGNGMALPGRRLYNNISNLNYYGDEWRPTASNSAQTNAKGTTWTPANGDRCGRDSGRIASQSTPHSFANGVTWSGAATSTLTQILIPNPWTGTQFTNPWAAGVKDTLPIFAYQAAATDVTPSVDVVGVTSAVWDGTKLDVVATVSNGNCTDLTLQTGAGNVAFNASCQATVNPYAYPTDGLTINVVSAQESIDVLNYPITNIYVPVAATAAADAFGAAATGDTVMDVLANDTGSNLQVVVATLGVVNKQSGTGTCGSVSATTADVTYTGGGGDAVCTFTYQAQAYWTGTPYGAASQATVTVTQTANQPPAFGSASYIMANGWQGNAYSASIAGYATDPDSDPITYSKDGGTCTWATVAADGTIGGTPTSTGACTVTARATATGGFDTTTLNITVNAAVAPLDGWTNLYSGTTGASPIAAGSFAVSPGSGTGKRMLLVAVTLETNTTVPTATTFSATYGGTALTQVVKSTVNQRGQVWIGRLLDSGIGTGSKALSVSYTVTGTTTLAQHVMWASFDYVNQTTPVLSSNAVGVGATTVANNAAVNYAAGGLTVAIGENGGTPATATMTATPTLSPVTTYTAGAQSSFTFNSDVHTATGNYASGGVSITYGGTTSARSAIGVASLQP